MTLAFINYACTILFSAFTIVSYAQTKNNNQTYTEKTVVPSIMRDNKKLMLTWGFASARGDE